jgi:Tfp pilus assembly protein PilF
VLRWIRPKAPTGLALFGALLFLVHPLQVESVAWISSFRDLISAFFLFAAILILIREGHGWRQWTAASLATVFFGLSLAAKPAAVIAPVLVTAILLTHDYLAQQPWRARLRDGRIYIVGVWLLIALGWTWLSSHLQPPSLLQYVTPVWQRPLIAGDAVTFYLGKWLWPWFLGADYGRSPQIVLADGWVWITALLPIGLAALLLWRPRGRGLFAALVIYVIGLLPVLGFVPFVFQYYSTVADRYTYVAMLGPALAVSFIPWQKRWITVSLLTFFAALTFRQVSFWQNSVTLFEHAIDVNPTSDVAYDNLGSMQLAQGQIDHAFVSFKKAVELNPRSDKAQNNLGLVYARKGQSDLAFAHYQQALRLNPTLPILLENLGKYYLDKNDLETAQTVFQKLIDSEPSAAGYNGLAVVYARREQGAMALQLWKKSLELNSQQPDANQNVGLYLASHGQPHEALVYLLAAAPTTSHLDSLNALTLQMATARGTPIFSPADAIQLAETLNRRRSDATIMRTLGVAQVNAGQPDIGRETLKKALTLAEQSHQAELIAQLHQDLQQLSR